MKLPDFEAWALFAQVARSASFSRAAAELSVSKATVSKAIARLEARLGTQLIQRTSRRLALTDAGRNALARAERMLAEAEAADLEAIAQAATPRGRVRMTAPVQFGIEHVAPLLPGLLLAYPDLTLDLHLTDETLDLVGGGFDLAVRIAALPDSSLRARRLCDVRVVLVGAPSYLAAHGHPSHPSELQNHRCFAYAYQADRNRRRFVSADGEEWTAALDGPLRTNSGEAFLPALRAGCGLATLPEFVAWNDIQAGRLALVMCQWRIAPLASLSLVMPPGGPRPARVRVVIERLARHLATAPWARRPEGGIVDAPQDAPQDAP